MLNAKINLIVIYTDNRDQLRSELGALGLIFQEHQHGGGQSMTPANWPGCAWKSTRHQRQTHQPILGLG